jgi:hypothetical protein
LKAAVSFSKGKSMSQTSSATGTVKPLLAGDSMLTTSRPL